MENYAWLLISSLLFLAWLVLFWHSAGGRGSMLLASVMVAPLAFTDTFWMQSYWAPPTLFDLGQRVTINIESFVFTFSMGGISMALLKRVWQPIDLPIQEPLKRARINRRFPFTLALPFVIPVPLYYLWDGNPIYWCLFCMWVGGLAGMYCFPEGALKLLQAAGGFLLVYCLPFWLVIALMPEYIASVWQLDQLSGVLILGFPLEEYLFALGFSLCANSVYLHLLWNRYARIPAA